jgi:hypothetical protein
MIAEGLLVIKVIVDVMESIKIQALLADKHF